ncbi:MAG: hypothetical protein AB1894_18165 [Chloroflexota bacterium]
MKLPVSHWLRSSLFWFLVTLLAIACVTALGPAEKTLGVHVRLVYLHGVWVWAALVAFLAAGLVGAAGLLARKETLHRWSRALGRTGLFFWITYLPISVWTMQANWNGLFLSEPRWRLAVIFATSGLLLQAGISLLEKPAWASAGNLMFILALFLALGNTPNVMHPPSPIFDSDAPGIQLYFASLFVLTLLGAWQVTRWWHHFESMETGTTPS